MTGLATRVWLVLLLVAVLAGCGGDSADEAAPERDAGPSTSSINKAAYRDSKYLCRLYGVKQVAKEYGGNPSDPISVADAYARQAYRPRFKAAALEGCLDGFDGR